MPNLVKSINLTNDDKATLESILRQSTVEARTYIRAKILMLKSECISNESIADKLDISDLLKKYPYEVSGGQKQRAAVARAMITNPKLILADEPTGALDSVSAEELLQMFRQVNASGQTILMVTHSVKAASVSNRVLFIKDGEVFHQIYRGEDTDEQMYQKINDTLTMLAPGRLRK